MVEYLKKAIEKPEEDISEVRDTVYEILARVKAEGEEAVRYSLKNLTTGLRNHSACLKTKFKAPRKICPLAWWMTLIFARLRFGILPRNK